MRIGESFGVGQLSGVTWVSCWFIGVLYWKEDVGKMCLY